MSDRIKPLDTDPGAPGQRPAGMTIGGGYRLFHGRRSKPAAYAVVGVCTVLTCALRLPALGAALLLPPQLTAERWAEL